MRVSSLFTIANSLTIGAIFLVFILMPNMKLIHSNLRNGEVKVLTQNLDDLWYLSAIIEPKDIVKGKTLRKIKVASSE